MYYYNLGVYFNDVVCAHGKRPMLRYPDQDYSYDHIAQWVEGLGALLLTKGCCRGHVIAIGHNKRPLSYALMLAALRLGIAYVNIDVASPVARSSKILSTSGALFLFYDDQIYSETMEELAAESGCELVQLDPVLIPVVSQEERKIQQNLMKLVDGACIAYVMFTSGSTGSPKGVAVTHQNVLHFICWGQQCFGIDERDNFANLSPMYFDNSVFDFYTAIFSGASLSPISRDLLSKPYDLVAHVGSMACTIWFSVPSLLMYLMTMKAFKENALPGLRLIIFGGEGYPKVELKKLYDRFQKQSRLVNVYGPTECTCICSAHTIAEVDFADLQGLPTLGRLNPNFDYRIIDDSGVDAAAGELCLIGPNVAAGYFNDIERSASSFITLLDANRFMKRMYKTGDLVRETDGLLYFLGRKDNQIKHMGYRIELEEIEHALVKLPQVNQAAVVYKRKDTSYGKIIGFIATEASIDEKELLEALSDIVPDYMIPSKIHISNQLPKNANGKVDRRQLEASLS